MSFNVDQIPPLNTVTIEILMFNVSDPSSDIDKMENIIKPDKGVTSELLQIANSALYGRSGRINSLRDALTMLGLKTVKNLVIMLNANKLKERLRGDIYKKHIHEYPVVCALIALDLCKPLKILPIKEDAFLMGLLHKIGMTVIALKKPAIYAALLQQSETVSFDLLVQEEDDFETNHVEVGSMAFEAWKFPVEMRKAISTQDFKAEEVGNVSSLTHVTVLASKFAKRLMGFPLIESEEAVVESIIKFNKIPHGMIEPFNADYFELLQDHPFLQKAIQG